MKHFSFLLGSGFSVPDGYPTTFEINEHLKKINAEEICINSDMSARFLRSETNLNSWSRMEEKLFVQRFLEFYNEHIAVEKPYHYEEFYDFYSDLYKSIALNEKSKKFFNDFRKESGLGYDHHNLLMNFNITFNQLLASLLIIKWPEPVTYVRPYATQYAEFLELIDELSNGNKIHLHSLNHDLLIEQLSHSETIGNEFSDGFTEIGSPFYGDHFHFDQIENKTKAVHTVRLKRFTDDFSKKFCLYKLHGSVDNYVFNLENKEYSMIKIPYGVQKYYIRKESFNKEGNREYHEDNFILVPDFLSGTSTKILSYDRKLYYIPLFNHFTYNLIESDFLIVIGYGFTDKKINEFLIDAFLVDDSKRMIVIDIKEPTSSLMEYKNVSFIGKSISDVRRDDIYQKMKG